MKKAKTSMLAWIILGVLGIFLIFGHNLVQDIICKIIAAALILTAVSSIVSWWKVKSKSPEALTTLAGSVVIGLIGLWILLNTATFIDLINIVLGAVIIAAGLINLYRGWKLHDTLTIVLACLGIVLGIVIACYNAATSLPVILEGIGLLYTAVIGLLGEWKKKK